MVVFVSRRNSLRSVLAQACAETWVATKGARASIRDDIGDLGRMRYGSGSRVTNMTSPLLMLRVDRVEGGQFIWVITEVGPLTDETELASSLAEYATASAALAHGEKVLAKTEGS